MLNKLKTLTKILLSERKIKSKSGYVKYIYEENDSEVLIVIFSGFPKENQSARYNFVRTLENIKANKLFILDDIGPNDRGAYYLGENMNFYYADLVIQLINNISNKNKIRKTIFLGSSKGGYASLYFGLKLKADIVISGAQQYHLGDYLYLKEHRNIYEYITGDRTNGSVENLNNLLIDEIKNSKWQPKIYLHYSERENTFKNHIRFLVEDLKNNNYVFCSDVKDYLEHSEVAKYFPSYVLSILDENL